MWHRNPLLEKKSSVVPGKRTRGRPPKGPGNAPGVTPAGQTSKLLRLQSENELLKGKLKLLEDQVAARGQRGTKRTAPEPVQDSGVLEDKAWLTECAVELRTGLQ